MVTAVDRLKILEYAKAIGSVTQTCQDFGISRTVFYRWKRRYETYGLDGLEDKIPAKPQMPNRVNAVTEKAILEQISKTPKDGPRQISYMLNHMGYIVGETGVYKVMQRHNLTKRTLRIAYAKGHARERSDIRQLAKIDIKLKQQAHQFPGYLTMETLKEWQPCKGHGKIYFYAIYDVYSKWGLIKLFPDKASINIAEIFVHRIAPLMKIFNVPIQNVLSEQLPEFEECWEYRWQAEKAIGKGRLANSIWELPESRKDLIQPIDNFTNLIFQALDELIIKRYEQSNNGGKIGFAELESMLEICMGHYNFKDPQSGKLPTEIVLDFVERQGVDLDTLPLWVYIRMV